MDTEAQTPNFVNQPLFYNKDTLKNNNNNREMKVQFAFWQLDFKYKTETKYVPADLHTTYSHVKMSFHRTPFNSVKN